MTPEAVVEIAPAPAPRVRPANWKELGLLLLMAFAILAPGIASLPPVDRDEPRYAVATTQMLASGNFVDIRYQAQPRYLQPAGIYWLQAIPTALFSSPDHRQIWTFRVPSLLGALFAVVMTGWAGSRVFGRNVGLGAAVFLASCLSLGFEARIGKTDGALLAAVATAQFALMRIYLAPHANRAASPWVAAVFWIAAGLAFLLKGPIIVLVSGLTVVSLLLWDRRVAWLGSLRALWGFPLFLLIAAPWYAAIGLVSHGQFFRTAIGKSMMGKVAVGQQAHGAPFGYHLAGLPLTFWPASFLLVLAAPFVWRERKVPAVRFLIAWIVPAWIAFEGIKTKLPHYVLPLFPALALLAALALFSPKVALKLWQKILFGVLAAIWLAASLLVSVLSPVALSIYEHRTDLLAVALTVETLAAVAALAWAMWKRRPEAVVMAVAATGFLTAVNLYMAGLPRLQSLWVSPQVEAFETLAKPCANDLLITAPYHEPSLVFLNGPAHTALAENPAEAADRLAAAPASGRCGMALVGEPQRPAFLARAHTIGLDVTPVTQIDGRDYADGKTVTLTLYAPYDRFRRTNPGFASRRWGDSVLGRKEIEGVT